VIVQRDADRARASSSGRRTCAICAGCGRRWARTRCRWMWMWWIYA